MSEAYIPPEVFTSNDVEADIEYFRVKAQYAKSPEAAAKYRKQLELLEDAVVIYRETRLPQFGIDLCYTAHALPSFPFSHARAQNFLKKVLDS